MMNLKPEELIRDAMRANPEEGIKELRKSSESTTKCCCAVQTTNEWYKLLMREAADQIERDQKEIAELREKQRWISAAEKEPEYDMPQLALTADGDVITANYAYGEWFDTWGQDVEVTHWMPLPELPKEDV